VSTTHPVSVIARQGCLVFLEYIIYEGMQAVEHGIPHGCCRVTNHTECFLQDSTRCCVTQNLKTRIQNSDLCREIQTESA
jgi:hypothetical protein